MGVIDREPRTAPQRSEQNRDGVGARLGRIWRSEKVSGWMLAAAVFGALWCMLIERLAQYWAVEAEYSFGWLVPLLAGYLFWLRWRSRPTASAPKLGWVRWTVGLTAFGLLPTWLIAQVNPDWRVVAWLLAAETVVLSLCVIYLMGGRSWLRHFAFSICLILAAVPWPTFFEEGITRVLTQLSTVATVCALNLVRIDAVQHGNLIGLRTGFVGMDEACSGIRSLQAVLMVTLFLGELYRTSFQRRYALALVGALIAFACNVARTTLLAGTAAKQGIESIATWHDPVGYVLMTVCFLLVLGAGRIIAGPLRALRPPNRAQLPRFPYRLLIGLGCWILFIGVGTEVWYRAHARAATKQWTFVWPVHKADFAEIPITKVEADELLFSEGRGAEWSNADGSHWVAYFFKWAEGPSWSRILARGHRPEVCLPAAGYKACGDHGTIEIQADGISIPFQALDFEDGGNKSYVFYCLWEEGLKSSERPRAQDKWSQFTRLRSVLLGERNLAQQTLEVVISGYDNPEAAEAAFRREIVTLISPGTKGVVADISGSLVVTEVANRK
jgi:exosortase